MMNALSSRTRGGAIIGGLAALMLLIGLGVATPAQAATGRIISPAAIQELESESAVEQVQYYSYRPRRRYYVRRYYAPRRYYARRYYRPRYYYYR